MSYVAKPTTGVHFKVQRTIFVNGKAKRQAVPKAAWHNLGISPTMSLHDARLQVKRLNKLSALEKKDARAIEAIARRLELERTINTVYTPEERVTEFVKYLKLNFIARHKSKTKMLSHWKLAQTVIRLLKLMPKEFAANKNAIVNYFVSNEYSQGYAEKILRLIDMWGQFCSEADGKFYKPMPKLDSYDIQLLCDAYALGEGYVGPSDPITPNDLVKLEPLIKPEQHNWLLFSVWFGLRPAEIDRIATARIESQVIHGQKVDVLVVYQEKLVRLPRDERYKYIPAWRPEQIATLAKLRHELKAPLPKTLKRYLDKKCGLYGGRKAFTDLMLGYKQSLIDISSWMGHASLDRTWGVYKNRKIVHFEATMLTLMEAEGV